MTGTNLYQITKAEWR